MHIKAISRTLLVVVVVVIIAIAGVAIYFLTSTPSGPTQIAGTIDVYVGYNGTKEGSNAQLFWIVAPSSATFKVGDTVKIVFHANNTFPDPHTFVIFDPNGNQLAQLSASPGQTKETTITLKIAGTYYINCITFCGTWHGLNGKMQRVNILTATS